MQKLLSDGLWPQVAKFARNQRCVAAVAYVTAQHLQFSEDDVLIADASDTAIASGETSAVVLQEIVNRGANVYSLSGLHSKILVCGDMAIIGSANLSNSGLIEASLCTDDPVTVSQTLAFIDRLTGMATPVDEIFLNHILAIEVKRKPRGGPRTTETVNFLGGRAWIVSVNEITEELGPEAAEYVSSGEKQAKERLSMRRNDVRWLSFPRKNQSRFSKIANEGDTVVQLWRAANRKRPVVRQPCAVLLRQEEPNHIRFFIEARSDADATALKFSDFQEIAVRAGITAKLGPNSTREIKSSMVSSLKDLWRKSSR